MNKNAGVAGVLGVIFPGLGHIYLGDWIRGIIFMLLWIGFGLFMALPKFLALIVGTADFGNVSGTFLIMFLIWIINVMGIFGEIKAIKKQQSNQSL